MQVKRTYEHKTYGTIGAVDLVAPDGPYTLNGTELPASSVQHLLTFALQTLQDAYAGAKDQSEATGNFNKKLDKLLSGTIGTRQPGAKLDAPDWMVAFMEEHRSIIKSSANVSGYKDMTAAERDEALIGWIKSQPAKHDRWMKAGEEILARRQAAKDLF